MSRILREKGESSATYLMWQKAKWRWSRIPPRGDSATKRVHQLQGAPILHCLNLEEMTVLQESFAWWEKSSTPGSRAGRSKSGSNVSLQWTAKLFKVPWLWQMYVEYQIDSDLTKDVDSQEGKTNK